MLLFLSFLKHNILVVAWEELALVTFYITGFTFKFDTLLTK